jgi:adenylate cyclase
MNSLLTPLTNIIHQRKGTIDKYMGDAIMAFWGAPIPMEDHATQAVRAALQMQQSLHGIQTSLSDFDVGELAMGIGLHTGPMNVGNMGSQFRMAYTVMGDAVNLGSRLEALTRQYGVDILVSDATREQAPGFLYLPVDLVRVKGKTEAVSICSPLAELEQVSPELTDAVEKMQALLADYRVQNWSAAFKKADEIERAHPRFSVLMALYRTRIESLQAQVLPEDWDGVFTHKTKG